MSLAPSEQRALAKIEDRLRTSDPRLAVMLATFTVLAAHRPAPHRPRRSRGRLRLTCTLAAIAATTILFVLLLTLP